MSVARTLLLAAIRGYKRHVSPRKGFSCAHRVYLGGCSCSTLGLRAISRHGAWRGLGVLRLRLRECRLVREQFNPRPLVPRPSEAGFIDCDIPCDAPCDMPHCSWSDGCDCLSWLDCGDCGGSGGSGGDDAAARRRRRRRGE